MENNKEKKRLEDNSTNTTTSTLEGANSSMPLPKEVETDVGQLELYSPSYALRVKDGKQLEGKPSEIGRGGEMDQVVKEIRRHVGAIKERVMEKLAAANSVPSDAMENARNFLETVVRDVTGAARGLTKDALSRIKTRLVDILPSLSPAVTRKIADDAAKEADGDLDQSEGEDGDHQNGEKENYECHRRVSSKAPYSSPTSSFFASLKPLPRL